MLVRTWTYHIRTAIVSRLSTTCSQVVCPSVRPSTSSTTAAARTSTCQVQLLVRTSLNMQAYRFAMQTSTTLCAAELMTFVRLFLFCSISFIIVSVRIQTTYQREPLYTSPTEFIHLRSDRKTISRSVISKSCRTATALTTQPIVVDFIK